MNWLDRWNDVIEYIEKHLDDEILIEEISKIVYCPPIHFQKMFSYLTDMTINEYIRKRKMTKAAGELQSSKTKVIDVAYKYGYDSPTAFNRAFRNVIGVSPSDVRKPGVQIKSFLPISFKIIIKGESEMNYRIVKHEAFRIVGVKRHYQGMEESMRLVPSFWDEIASSGQMEKMCSLMNQPPLGILGVCTNSNTEDFDYWIAVASSLELLSGFDELMIPENTWAVFECIGKMPDAIQNVQKRINCEWLPNSEYQIADCPDLEVYFEGDQSSDDYRCEVWIPIIKKK